VPGLVLPGECRAKLQFVGVEEVSPDKLPALRIPSPRLDGAASRPSGQSQVKYEASGRWHLDTPTLSPSRSPLAETSTSFPADAGLCDGSPPAPPLCHLPQNGNVPLNLVTCLVSYCRQRSPLQSWPVSVSPSWLVSISHNRVCVLSSCASLPVENTGMETTPEGYSHISPPT